MKTFTLGFVTAFVALIAILWADHYFGGTIQVILKGVLPNNVK